MKASLFLVEEKNEILNNFYFVFLFSIHLICDYLLQFHFIFFIICFVLYLYWLYWC